MQTVIVTAFGEVVIPAPVRNRALVSAVRKHRNVVKAQEYADRLMYRWARGTAYLLWKSD